MLEEAKKDKLIKRIEAILAEFKISEDISYTLQEKDGIYQCVIKYQRNTRWTSFWATTGYKTEKGNLRNAKKVAEEISNIFKETVKEYGTNAMPKVTSIIDFQTLMDLNTTNYNPNKKTKADWDFYEYMEYWVENVIITSVAPDTYVGYEKLVKGRLKDYFTMEEHRKAVKEITPDDLDDFYDYLRKQNLKNGTIDHYNDNISSAFKTLLKKKIVRYNPTTLINPIVVEVEEVPTYTKEEIEKLFEVFKGELIELPTLIDAYYGLRHSIATLLHMEGVDIRDLQDWLGHESITSTNRYTRSDFQKQVATANTVSKIFQKNSNENKSTNKRFIAKRKQVDVAV